MSDTRPKLLIVQVAALGWNLFKTGRPHPGGLDFSPLEPLTPGLTCPAQASFRTAAPPSSHGMVANGLYHRPLRRPMFWEQAAAQVEGPRIWDAFRARGGTVGMMFWQQSLGEKVDLAVSPRPIHKHSGGMIQACYTRPADLYDRLRAAVGRDFNLMHYWGPPASRKSSEWIVDATCAVLEMDDVRPDALCTYLPHLDYDTQRFGIDHPKADKAFADLDGYLRRLRSAAEARGYQLVVWGDYAMHNVTGPAVFPNRALRRAGLLDVQRVKGMAYPDLFDARAFAMVDHELAHVYIPDPSDLEPAAELLRGLDGVDRVFRTSEVPELDHPNAGNLVAFAEPGRWFAYPWWSDRREAPDFARHVDIHNKPGFDACELFFGRFPWQVSQDTGKVGGCHGHGGQTAWASTDPGLQPAGAPPSLIDLAAAVRDRLEP